MFILDTEVLNNLQSSSKNTDLIVDNDTQLSSIIF